ncbi:MAG: hypothetical protein JWP97_1868 [Labilithrix sp.]|nr:hypothetical protein [Labilithrix sp.]
MRSRELGMVLVAAFLGCAGVALVQPPLATAAHTQRQRDDVFLLPPPAEVRAMSLGYRSATADVLWAKLILEYGLHWQEKRPFPDATRYVDAILALEPGHPTLYEFVDTILVYPPPPGATEADARTARAYLERGTRERPYDAAMWLRYGQFVAFIGPSFLKDKAEGERWRVDGANGIARAVELGSDANRSLAATSILSTAGERKAAIASIERTYAMTDDPAVREEMLLRLSRLKATAGAEQALSVVEREWRTHYGFLTRGEALLLGPSRGVPACAGPASLARRECAADWTAKVEAAQ